MTSLAHHDAWTLFPTVTQMAGKRHSYMMQGWHDNTRRLTPFLTPIK